MCRYNNQESNQQLRNRQQENQPPRQGNIRQVEPRIAESTARRILNQIPASILITTNEIRAILSATTEFDNRSFDTQVDDNWSIPSTESETTFENV